MIDDKEYNTIISYRISTECSESRNLLLIQLE
jgi:hypothetical protein